MLQVIYLCPILERAVESLSSLTQPSGGELSVQYSHTYVTVHCLRPQVLMAK